MDKSIPIVSSEFSPGHFAGHLPGHFNLACCSDTLNENVHFFAGIHCSHIAYKSLAVNLSDMAAMGAYPLSANVSYDPGLTVSSPLQSNDDKDLPFYFQKYADQANLQHINIDSVHGSKAISVVMFGYSLHAIQRNSAQNADLIFVSGYLGDAAYGLSLVKQNQLETSLAEIENNPLVQRLHRPIPRLKLGQALVGIASSCIDISDGFVGDLEHICRASQLGANIYIDKIPRSKALQTFCPDQTTQLCCALYGGDDYELCFTVSPNNLDRLRGLLAKHQVPCTQVGVMCEGTQVELIGETLTLQRLDRLKANSYQHFS